MAWTVDGLEYTTRKKITIDQTKIDADLTNFPVLAKLTDDAEIGVGSNADGFDIRFTGSDGSTLLKYERESWAIAGGVVNACFWVKVPAVDDAVDTDFYIYYRTTDTADGADSTNVWDANFMGVWHLKDDPDTSTVQDSTTNNYDGTKGSAANPNEVAGKIAKGQNYDAGAETIELGNVLGWERTQSVTIEAWGKHTVADSYDEILSKGQAGAPYAGWFFWKWNSSNGHTLVVDLVNTAIGPTMIRKRGSTALNDNVWRHLVMTYDGSSTAAGVKLYVSAVEENYTVQNDNLSASILTAVVASIGNRDTPATNNQVWQGILDEVRISYVVRSFAWIKASYNSGNNSLLSLGGEETPPVAAVGQNLMPLLGVG